MATQTKKWYQSKTIWINALTLIGSGLAAITSGDLISENPEIAAVVSGAVALINIILRKITKQEIK